MAFYTPTWVRRLVKEDHESIQKYVLKDARNDFRTYIDSVTPFVLWLDIGLIRERIIDRSKDLIKELAQAVSQQRDVTQIVTDIIDKAYIATINNFASNPKYKRITQEELETLLSSLSNAPSGEVKKTITNNFKRTMVVDKVTKKDRSVMLIFPKFTTVDFGTVYKKELEKIVNASTDLLDAPKGPQIVGMFAQLGGLGVADSEKQRIKDFVNENFARLQNIGHVEVDVISEQEKTVKRAQNSPRLLQALVSLPQNDSRAFQRLQLKFSRETGQANTRVKIRKQFSGSKLIFELLVEHGLAVGIPETQADNLTKAKLERAFLAGKGLTAKLRDNTYSFINLETSKSMVQYLGELIPHILKTGKSPASYNKTSTIAQSTNINITKVTLANVAKSSNYKSKISNNSKTKAVAASKTGLTNLAKLQALLDSSLEATIKKNMGSGSRRDILNLRSGRLAESVKVTKLSPSRQGMVTAFYTYMRNPYATFSQGGKQQYPRSRDPKLLISGSIREIAKQMAVTRLRAVAA